MILNLHRVIITENDRSDSDCSQARLSVIINHLRLLGSCNMLNPIYSDGYFSEVPKSLSVLRDDFMMHMHIYTKVIYYTE